MVRSVGALAGLGWSWGGGWCRGLGESAVAVGGGEVGINLRALQVHEEMVHETLFVSNDAK